MQKPMEWLIDRVAQGLLDADTQGDWTQPKLNEIDNSEHYRVRAQYAISAMHGVTEYRAKPRED